MLREIVKQLELCNYECEAGLLINNESFVKLKELAAQESIPLDAQVSLLLAGYDEKITDHINYFSMEMSSKYMLIVYREENDNQYFANSGLVPNRIEKVGTANNITYMLIRR